jgi:hypothetical protein
VANCHLIIRSFAVRFVVKRSSEHANEEAVQKLGMPVGVNDTVVEVAFISLVKPLRSSKPANEEAVQKLGMPLRVILNDIVVELALLLRSSECADE